MNNQELLPTLDDVSPRGVLQQHQGFLMQHFPEMNWLPGQPPSWMVDSNAPINFQDVSSRQYSAAGLGGPGDRRPHQVDGQHGPSFRYLIWALIAAAVVAGLAAKSWFGDGKPPEEPEVEATLGFVGLALDANTYRQMWQKIQQVVAEVATGSTWKT